MNASAINWLWSDNVLLWFASTLLQTTLLTSLGLLAARCWTRQPVMRHSVLTVTLALVVIAPLSSWCMQRFGVLTISIPIGDVSTSDSKPNEHRALVGHPMNRQATDVAVVPQIVNAAVNTTTHGSHGNLSEDALDANVQLEQPREKVAQSSIAFDDSSRLQQKETMGATAITSGGILRTLLRIAGVLWLSGCGVVLVRWVVAWFRLKRIMGRAEPIDDGDVWAAYQAACRQVGCMSDRARLLNSATLATPVVVGVLRPTISLPGSLIRHVSTQQLIDVLVHELAHVVRRDQVSLILQQLACTLFWAHPLVHCVRCCATRASEEICDNYVLAQRANTAYSQTLLRIAELAASQRNPLGAIGVVGGWSLTERIAGLLDAERVPQIQLRGRGLLAVLSFAVSLSIVLLLNVKYIAQPVIAQTTDATQPARAMEPKQCFRGSGDQFQFRLSGKLLTSDQSVLKNPVVTVIDIDSNKMFKANVIGERYEIWLPVKAFRWYNLRLSAQTSNGLNGGRWIAASQLRSAILQGVDLQLQAASKSVKVQVVHKTEPVAQAKVKAVCSSVAGLNEIFVKTNAQGEANLKMGAADSLSSLTVWTDAGLLGGYQFHQQPARDPLAQQHVVELVKCRERRIHVVDTEGKPLPGAQLTLHVATPEPYFNYFGNPIGCECSTNDKGMASYRWFPQIERAHHYAELIDESQWIIQAQHNTDDAIEVVLARRAPRVRIEGVVSSDSESPAGLIVEARSFQGEQANQSDSLLAIADQTGKFSLEMLPGSTYAMLVLDDQLVSEVSLFTPGNANGDEKSKPKLTVLKGHPVKIQLTSGPKRRPIANQSVSLRSDVRYSWLEDGKKRNGMASRDIYVTTDQQGQATAFTPLGELRASVYTSAWRSEAKTDVKANASNQIELHRPNDVTTKAVGRLRGQPSRQVDPSQCSVTIRALDGEISEELKPKVDKSGEFRFDVETNVVGIMVYSADGELAATKLIEDLTQPFEVELLPSAFLSGQLLDGDGRPVANHSVTARSSLHNKRLPQRTTSFSGSMIGPVVETKTDADGNYRIGPLPRYTEIELNCKPLVPGGGEEERLGRAYVELDEQRPHQVHRLGEPASGSTQEPTPEQHLAALLRDAKLGGYHVMIILTDTANDACRKFIDDELLDYDTHVTVGNYMQFVIDSGEGGKGQTKAFATKRQWPIPPDGSVSMVALDAAGKELGRAIVEVSPNDAASKAAAFVQAHLPTMVDARQKWDEAFALAKKTNRRVWVRISQRYCGPCHVLNRWLDDHREVLEKEFVLLKVDDVRDRQGADIAKYMTGNQPYGVPFFAFYNADQNKLIDSQSPLGNIGAISGFEGKRHFRKMLERGNLQLTENDIEQLLDSLE